MKLLPIRANMTEVEIGGKRVLFSYQTPVAYYTPKGGYFVTAHKYSQTTTRHINHWLDGVPFGEVPQATINGLVD